MNKGNRMLFTVPLELDEIIGIHVAAKMKDTRNATALVYNFIRVQIREARTSNPKEFETMFKEQRERVAIRSNRKIKERKRKIGTVSRLRSIS